MRAAQRQEHLAGVHGLHEKIEAGAGNTVLGHLRIYARCIAGRDEINRRRIEEEADGWKDFLLMGVLRAKYRSQPKTARTASSPGTERHIL